MHSVKRLGLLLGVLVIFLCGCGSGPGPAPLPPPSTLSYTTSAAGYFEGTPIPVNAPFSTGGPVTAYGVNPNLPAGLTLNTTPSVITGTPAAAMATASYTPTPPEAPRRF